MGRRWHSAPSPAHPHQMLTPQRADQRVRTACPAKGTGLPRNARPAPQRCARLTSSTRSAYTSPPAVTEEALGKGSSTEGRPGALQRHHGGPGATRCHCHGHKPRGGSRAFPTTGRATHSHSQEVSESGPCIRDRRARSCQSLPTPTAPPLATKGGRRGGGVGPSAEPEELFHWP